MSILEKGGYLGTGLRQEVSLSTQHQSQQHRSLYLRQHGEQYRSLSSDRTRKGLGGGGQSCSNVQKESLAAQAPVSTEKAFCQNKQSVISILQNVFEGKKAFFKIGL